MNYRTDSHALNLTDNQNSQPDGSTESARRMPAETASYAHAVAYSTFTPSPPTASEFYESARAFDNARTSFTGEHALVCGAGAALLTLARIGRPFELRLLVGALGIGLLARAASGRDGYLQKTKDALK